MNMKREEETVEVYAQLLAKEVMEKNPSPSPAILELILQRVFIQGAQWGLKRGEELAENAIVTNFSKIVQETLSAS